jgi:hypothetical protein
MGKKRSTCRVLVERPEGERTPGRLGIHVKMELKETCSRAWTKYSSVRTGVSGRLL